jgi:hypothetical protein
VLQALLLRVELLPAELHALLQLMAPPERG